MQVRSLSTELLVSVSLLLVVFFGVTIVALDFVFRDLVETSMRDRLNIQIGALIAASQEDEPQTSLAPDSEFQNAQVRFNNPGSGLYGEIRLNHGPATWRSQSLAGTGLGFPSDMKLNERRLNEIQRKDGSAVLALSYCIEWQFETGKSAGFIYSVAENLDPYHAQLNRFRVNLFGGFGILIAVLVVSFGILFRRVLRPLRRIEHEIEEIEVGAIAEVGGGYPRELLGVTANLNALLRSERERLARYRNSLGNLAHSLKTPLVELHVGGEADPRPGERVRAPGRGSVIQANFAVQTRSGIVETHLCVLELTVRRETRLRLVFLRGGDQCTDLDVEAIAHRRLDEIAEHEVERNDGDAEEDDEQQAHGHQEFGAE